MEQKDEEAQNREDLLARERIRYQWMTAASFVEGVGRDSRSVGLGDHCGVACRRPTSPERRPALGPA